MKRHPLDHLTRFVLTAALGTAAIIAVAPFVRPTSLPQILDGPSRWLRSFPAFARTAESLNHALTWQPAEIPVPTAVPAPVAVPASTIQRENRWAITCVSDVPTYRLNGASFRHYNAGTTLIVLDSRESTVGLVYRCKLPPPDPGINEFLVPAASVNVYQGSLGTVMPDTLKERQHYARLQADLKRAKQAAKGGVREDNPFLAAYRVSQTASEDFEITARNLEKRFRDATGDERMRCEDERRRMRGQSVDIQRELTAARQRYDKWNVDHPASNNVKSPEVKRQEAALATLSASMGESARSP